MHKITLKKQVLLATLVASILGVQSSAFAFLTEAQVTSIVESITAGIVILVGLGISLLIAVNIPKLGLALSKKILNMMGK